MPVIEIQALVAAPPDVPALLASTAHALAEALDIDVRRCWVTFREIAPGAYYEGGKLRAAADAADVAPLVTIITAAGRTPDQKTRALRAVAQAVGAGLGTDPDNVFVEYREMPPGHVHTGGQIR